MESKNENSVNVKRLLFGLGLSLMLAGRTLHAQQSDADHTRLAELRAKAETGDAQAQNELGVCYAKGQGVAKDAVEAAKWYRKAAEQNLAEAQLNLGVCYDNAQGVTRDPVEAVKWYRKAAEQNLARAQFNLAFCYDKGQGVVKDQAETAKWYRKAAEQNLPAAQYFIGICYLRGRGVEKDEVEGVKWVTLAAAQGDGHAKVSIRDIKEDVEDEQFAAGEKRAKEWLAQRKKASPVTQPHP